MSRQILVGLLSGWQYPERRQLVRETYAPDLKRRGHDVVFLMGAGAELTRPVRDHGSDMLYLPVPNSYPSLPMRTRAFCEWALKLDWKWDAIFKADDDTFIASKRFHQFAQTATEDYLGVEFHPQMSYHSGGAGYFLSRRAAQIIAREMIHPEGAEDQIVGAILNRAGIPTAYKEDMKVGHNHDQRRPMAGNKFLVAHGRWLTTIQWRDSHHQVSEE